MALFYSDKSAKKSTKPTACRPFTIQDLDYQGLGVAKVEGKTWFVENALPNEQVEAVVIEENASLGGQKRSGLSKNRQIGKCQVVQFMGVVVAVKCSIFRWRCNEPPSKKPCSKGCSGYKTARLISSQ